MFYMKQGLSFKVPFVFSSPLFWLQYSTSRNNGSLNYKEKINNNNNNNNNNNDNNNNNNNNNNIDSNKSEK